MITTIEQKATEMSTVDALWTLIQGQTKAVRKALTKRLLAEQAREEPSWLGLFRARRRKTESKAESCKADTPMAADRLRSGGPGREVLPLFEGRR